MSDHVPLEKKAVRANLSPFMTESPRKAIVTRTRLRNRYNYLITDENLKAFKEERNRCVKLLREAKNGCYGNLN